MEDKTFELLTKMYSEFTQRFDRVDERLDKLEARQSNIEDRQAKLEIMIENDVKPHLNALLDGYRQTYEKLEEHDRRFEAIEDKLQSHDVEIRVIRGGK